MGRTRTHGNLTAYDIAESRSRSDFMALLPKPDPNYMPETRVCPSPEAPSDDWGTVIAEFLKMPVSYAVLAGMAAVLALVLKRKRSS